MKWGGGGGPEGGGPGCCAEVHGVNGVQGGGALGIHNTIHNTTQTRHVYGGGGGGGWGLLATDHPVYSHTPRRWTNF
jgi:hypothetical protein